MIIGSGEGLNTSSSIFRKSISEMIYLIKHFKGKEETIYGLAGIGDLYVVQWEEEIVKWENI